MYRIILRDEIVGSFNYFFEAWLSAILEFPDYTSIKGPDGIWINRKFN